MKKTVYEIVERQITKADIIEKDFRSAYHINGDNVAIYVFNNKKEFGLTDCLRAVPPYPSVFVEYSLPIPDDLYSNLKKNIPQLGSLNLPSYGDIRLGVLIRKYDLSKTEDQYPTQMQYFIDSWKDKIRWLLWINIFSVADGEIHSPNPVFNSYLIGLDNYGIIASDGNQLCKKMIMKPIFDIPGDAPELTIVIALMTMSFMNCKNVVLDEVNPIKKIPGKSSRRRYISKPYHVIRVHSLQHQKEKEETITCHDNSLPEIHIRRGHFKDFTDGEGLFGRIHGLFWWEYVVVNKKREGKPKKNDYDVFPDNINLSDFLDEG